MPQRSFAFGRGRPTPAVLGLLVILVVAYIATAVATRFVPGLYEGMILDADAVVHGQVWRLLSYGLLHDLGSPFHLLMNGLMFYLFGPALEARWGTARFLGFVAIAIAVGGLFVVAGAMMGISTGYAIGFSAAVEASIVAWGILNRNTPVTFMFAISMRGIHLVWVAVFFAVLDAVSHGSTSAAAHFGGIAVGAVVGLGLFSRNTRTLWMDKLLVKLRLRRAPKLTIVPKGPSAGGGKWVH